MLRFDPEKTTQEDIVYLFFNSEGIEISEEFYEYIDIKKVRRKAIKKDYKSMVDQGVKKMEIYADLAYKYSVSEQWVREICTKNNS